VEKRVGPRAQQRKMVMQAFILVSLWLLTDLPLVQCRVDSPFSSVLISLALDQWAELGGLRH
jgi:hypothetical protein